MSTLTVGMCPTMNSEVLKKLNSKNIFKVLDFISTDPEKITSFCGISYKKVLAIRRLLLAQYSSFPINGLTLYKKTLDICAVLPTGCSDIDVLLEDGIYTGEITEIVGVSVSGKTQFCESLAVNVAATLDQNVICIDTSVGWSPQRLAQILSSKFPSSVPAIALSRIRLSPCFNYDQLEKVLSQICSSLQNQDDSFFSSLKLIVIDSVASVLSPRFFSGTYIDGLSLLQEFGKKLNSIANQFNIAILITNDMVSSSITPSGEYAMKPALGRCWTYVPSVRMLFRPNFEPCDTKSFNSFHQHIEVTLDKSPRSKIRTSSFKLCSSGIESIK